MVIRIGVFGDVAHQREVLTLLKDFEVLICEVGGFCRMIVNLQNTEVLELINDDLPKCSIQPCGVYTLLGFSRTQSSLVNFLNPRLKALEVQWNWNPWPDGK